MTDFADFDLDPKILQALDNIDYKKPSPIQGEVIPLVKKNHDVIALAETGSGKTAACAIPICDRVDVAATDVQALIIVPTRELALQYATEAQRIGKIRRVKAFAIYGGEDPHLQLAKLKHGVQVLIATPGRLVDFIFSRSIDLSQVATLILDEADEMLSMGFYEDIDFIIQCLVHEHQTLLFSATMPKDIKRLAKKHMIDPKEVVLISKKASPSSIEHQFLFCSPRDKNSKLVDVIRQQNPHQAIVFCQSRTQCEQVCRFLKQKINKVDFLHGGLGQDIRTSITGKFRSGRIRFLVATDVAARGLDFSEVSHVFLYNLGRDPDLYVHRSGRTGRYKRKGMAVTLVTDRDLGVLQSVLRRIDREPIWIGAPPRKRSGDSESRSRGSRRGGRRN